MQCHRCPKSITNGGTPDEECFTCKCAEYLDNDHKTVIPSDDVSRMQIHAEPSYFPKDDDYKDGPFKPKDGITQRNIEDCENVLAELKNCHHTSFQHIACMVALFMMVGNGSNMLGSLLDGRTMAEIAKSTGTTKQNISQKWNRVVSNIPFLSEITAQTKKRKSKKNTET